MTQRFNKLMTLLKELFQLDQPDLDFGVYRVMHAKRLAADRRRSRALAPALRRMRRHDLGGFCGLESVSSRSLSTATLRRMVEPMSPKIPTTDSIQELATFWQR